MRQQEIGSRVSEMGRASGDGRGLKRWTRRLEKELRCAMYKY